MATYVKHSIGRRLLRIIAGAYLAFVAYKGFALHPQVALIIGAIGAIFLFSALWKYQRA